MRLAHSIQHEVLVIRLEGSLAAWEILEIGTQLKDLITNANNMVVMDLTQVDQIDAAGIGVLTECHRRLTERGSNLLLAGAKGPAANAIRMAQLSEFMQMAMTVDQAITMAAPTLEIDPDKLLDDNEP